MNEQANGKPSPSTTEGATTTTATAAAATRRRRSSTSRADQEATSASGVQQVRHTVQLNAASVPAAAAATTMTAEEQDAKVAAQHDKLPPATLPGAVAVVGGEEEERTFSKPRASAVNDVEAMETTTDFDKRRATKSTLDGDDDAEKGEDSLLDDAKIVDSKLKDVSEPTIAEVPTLQAELVRAEIVAEPVEAFHVAIDEDTSAQFFPLEMAGPERNVNRSRSKRSSRNLFWAVVVSLLVVVLLCAILIPVLDVKVEGPTAGISFPTQPTPAPTFPYPCYTSTYDVLLAQRDEEELPEAYIMCPNTRIEIGVFRNPSLNDFSFVDGDYPLYVIRENVTIQCGLDGRKENNCVLDGGFMHMLLMQFAPTPNNGDWYIFNNTIDNMVIRGMTFTGQPANAGPFTGNSITLSHPGRNLRFEDCHWANVTAQNGMIGAYHNHGQYLLGLSLEDYSVEATFSDCIFENIIYDLPLIHVERQTMHFERCIFRNVELSLLTQKECFINSESLEIEMAFPNGCAGLMYCGAFSTCTMEDVCLSNIEHNGVSLVFVTNETEATFTNVFLDHPIECQQATAEIAFRGNEYFCSDIFTVDSTCPVVL